MARRKKIEAGVSRLKKEAKSFHQRVRGHIQRIEDRDGEIDHLKTLINDAQAAVSALIAEDGNLKRYNDLRDRGREILESNEVGSWLDGLSTLASEREDLVGSIKNDIRLLENPVVRGRYRARSQSSGSIKTWDIPTLKELGLGAIIVGNVPLIKVAEVVDGRVWRSALESGLIDLDSVIEAGGYKETPKSRRAIFEIHEIKEEQEE
jgi:hypothetical protein